LGYTQRCKMQHWVTPNVENATLGYTQRCKMQHWVTSNIVKCNIGLHPTL
jgi:hypothetical protein